MKHVFCLRRPTALAVLALALFLTACGAPARSENEDGLSRSEGRILFDVQGVALLILEDGTPMVLSVQADGDDPFSGLANGDRVFVEHDGVDETWPARTGAYEWGLLEKGAMEDLPEETLAGLEDLGWDLGRDTHAAAPEPRTVEDPVSGYCGNTVTEVILDGETYSIFWGDDSVNLTDLLINLSYDEGICRCQPEFTVNTEFGDGYGVNLTEYYVRYGEGQCPITEEQAERIRGILERNCSLGQG